MPAPKSLRLHVLDRTFRSRRHHRLLASDELLADSKLAELQRAYRQAGSERERRELGVTFEQAVKALDDVQRPPEGGPKSRDQLRAELDALLNGPLPPDEPLDVGREMRRTKVRDQYLHGMYGKRDEPIRRGTLAEIAASVGVSPSTARRYLQEFGIVTAAR
jgi:hypothetical protein